MDLNQPSAIIELENTLKLENIKVLIERFISSYISSEEPPIDINHQLGIVYYYDSHINDVIGIKFENTLNDILWNITNSIKSEIDRHYFSLSQNEKSKYLQSILNSLEYIKNKNIELFGLFPICSKPQQEIQNYLKEKYFFNPVSLFDDGSFFHLKPRYSTRDLRKIYDFITGELYLDDELYSFEDFTEVFFKQQTEKSLIFNCQTPIIIRLFEKLKLLFTDFNRSRIEQSGRFFTRQKKTISVNIYQSNISRVPKNKVEFNRIDEYFASTFPN